MVIINPNNPTGSLYSDKVLKEMTDLAGEHDLFVISDEIYDLMTFDGVHHSPASLNKDVPMILVQWVLQGRPTARMEARLHRVPRSPGEAGRD